jgi:hypothetical protein
MGEWRRVMGTTQDLDGVAKCDNCLTTTKNSLTDGDSVLCSECLDLPIDEEDNIVLPMPPHRKYDVVFTAFSKEEDGTWLMIPGCPGVAHLFRAGSDIAVCGQERRYISGTTLQGGQLRAHLTEMRPLYGEYKLCYGCTYPIDERDAEYERRCEIIRQSLQENKPNGRV